MDSAGQTKSASTAVTVTCPGPEPEPEPAGGADESRSPPRQARSSGTTRVRFTPVAAAGIKQVELFLGARKICTLTQAPFDGCDVTATGADVGSQALRVVVTDALGTSAQANVTVRVAKFATSVKLKVAKKNLSGGKARRTITGTVAVPKNVTHARRPVRAPSPSRSSVPAAPCSTSA